MWMPSIYISSELNSMLIEKESEMKRTQDKDRIAARKALRELLSDDARSELEDRRS